MIKKLYFLVFFIFLLTQGCKKNIPAPVSHSGIKYLEGSGQDKVRSVIRTNDGGFLFVGYLEKGINTDAFILKTDNAGKKLWYKSFGGPNPELFNHAIALADGGFFAVGYTSSKGFDSANAKKSAYVVRLDANGNTIWEKTYGTVPSELTFAYEKPDHTVLITGYQTNANIDVCLLSIDAEGKMNFFKSWADYSSYPPTYNSHTWNEFGNAINLLDDGSILLGGVMNKSNYVAELWNIATFTTVLTSKGNVIKSFYPGLNYTRQGTNYFGNNMNNSKLVKKLIPVNILKTNDGFLLSTLQENSQGVMSVELFKIPATGDLINRVWEKQYTLLGTSQISNIFQNEDGSFYITGSSSSNIICNGAYPELFKGTQAMIMKVDNKGNLLWTGTTGSEFIDCVSMCMQPLANGELGIAGYSVSEKDGYHKMIWMKFDKNGKLINEN